MLPSVHQQTPERRTGLEAWSSQLNEISCTPTGYQLTSQQVVGGQAVVQLLDNDPLDNLRQRSYIVQQPGRNVGRRTAVES